ncbi:acyclic terpene utilization AtuA family protein [Brevundimonas sp.]|uniref:acyclic terpene utilization AtuA family protein n=1 Tax=Brevundimonas sp. TaxID=1871086 RepID=UPI00248728F8|nr:acyclic terpene utilization AtuA family protein [Brevundimonas sp.]MDI1281789.1 DUF1446 domain-containing protein [Brevundimonas sp.]
MTGLLRIGCASGFWGDSMTAAPQLVASGAIDFLVFDYLAEITMAILARARVKDPRFGYATDFVDVTLRETLSEIARRKIRVVSNAGGVNPIACGEAIKALVAELGLDLTVAVVTGDDLLGDAARFAEQGVQEMFSKAPFPARPLSINAYLGAFPIAAALDRGADIVVTGRCVDSAVTLGPCIHHFGWTPDALDRLAGGSLAGHILECGAQATGGVFTDWEDVPDYAAIGYPIAEIDEDGSFTVTKPEGTGGLVSRGTVAEQMLYEIGDPQAYVLPDVTCDFSAVEIAQAAPHRVRVTGARGRPAPPSYKVCATHVDGHRLALTLAICGIDADRKARAVADAVFARMARRLAAAGAPPFTATSVEVLGAEASYGPHGRIVAPREVILKIAARHGSPAALAALLREATSSGTSMTPGITGVGGNRPKPMPMVRLFSFLIDKREVTPSIHVGGETVMCPDAVSPGSPPSPPPAFLPAPEQPVGEMVEVPLVALAWARSGDKGNDANIGVIARAAGNLPWIAAALDADTVARHFGYLGIGSVERFFLPGIGGLNFLLHDALGGGGTASLRNDPQGKGLAQILLDHPIPVPIAIAAARNKETAA